MGQRNEGGALTTDDLKTLIDIQEEVIHGPFVELHAARLAAASRKAWPASAIGRVTLGLGKPNS
jgi:hypothetical protein